MLPLLKKPVLESSSPANYTGQSRTCLYTLQCSREVALTRLRPHLLGSTNFSHFHSAYRAFRRDCTARDSRQCVPDSQSQAIVTVLIGFALFAVFDTVTRARGTLRRTAAVRVRHYRNTADLVPVLPRGPDPVCQAGSTSVTSCGAQGRRSSGVCARASVFRQLLQPGG